MQNYTQSKRRYCSPKEVAPLCGKGEVNTVSRRPTVAQLDRPSQPDFLDPPTGGLNTIEHLTPVLSKTATNKPKKKRQESHLLDKCASIMAFTASGEVVAIPCGQWSCPQCAKHNSRMWAWRVRIHVDAAADHRAYFWTVTMRGKYRTAAAAYKDFPRLWKHFQRAIKRKTGKWSYCAFVEGHPRRGKIPHFHIISMQKCPGRLKDIAMEAGFGFQATETRVTSTRAANYCAKYASKQGEGMPKGFRRVRASHDWSKLPDVPGKSLLVKRKKEALWEFIIRVSEEIGVDAETLAENWQSAAEYRAAFREKA